MKGDGRPWIFEMVTLGCFWLAGMALAPAVLFAITSWLVASLPGAEMPAANGLVAGCLPIAALAGLGFLLCGLVARYLLRPPPPPPPTGPPATPGPPPGPRPPGPPGAS